MSATQVASLAEAAHGFVCADLAALVDEAAMCALRRRVAAGAAPGERGCSRGKRRRERQQAQQQQQQQQEGQEGQPQQPQQQEGQQEVYLGGIKNAAAGEEEEEEEEEAEEEAGVTLADFRYGMSYMAATGWWVVSDHSLGARLGPRGREWGGGRRGGWAVGRLGRWIGFRV